MEWIEVKIRKISELKTKEERKFMVTELRNELKYYKNGGILQYVLRNMI